MKACNCSARAVRRAEDEFRLRQGQLPSFAKPLIGLTAVLVTGALTFTFWPASTPETSPTPSPVSSAETRAQEAAIYSAMDLADRSQAQRILKHLSSPDDSLRLAALRYVAKVDPEPYLDQLLPLLDDKSKRIRAAAVQMLARIKPDDSELASQISRRLVAVLVDEERELGERVLAVASLRSHKPKNLVPLTKVLDDPQLSEQVSDLLAKWSGKTIKQAEGETLRAAWERELGAGA